MKRKKPKRKRTWRWDENSQARFPDELAPVVGAELEAVRDKKSGRVDIHKMVDRARKKDHPLHDLLTWDDSVAGEKWRVHEMRNIVRVLIEVDTDEETGEEVTFRAVASLARDPGYRTMRDIMGNEQLQVELLEQARRELAYFRQRYKTLQELAEVFGAIDKFLE